MASHYRTYYYRPAKLTYGDLDLKKLREECDLDFAHYTYGKDQCSCCYGPRNMPAKYWRDGKVLDDSNIEYILFKNAYNCGGTKKKSDKLATYPQMYSSYEKEHVYINWQIHSKEKRQAVKKALESQVGSEFIVEIPDDDMYCIKLTRRTITKKTYAKQIVDAYINVISDGVATGYGMLETLSNKQRKILIDIASAVTDRKMDYLDLKDFIWSAKRNNPEFDKYVENVILAREDLIENF